MALASTGVLQVDGASASADDAHNAGYFNPSQTGAGTDYSLGAPLACSDLAIDATTNTKVSSASIGFTSAHVGNGLRITAGTGFTTGLFEIVSVSSGVATLDRAAGTTSSTGGTARVGGPLATPGIIGALTPASGMIAFVHYWSTPYNLSSSANVSGGRLNLSVGMYLVGYDTNRTLGNVDANRPTLNANAASMTAVTMGGTAGGLQNLILDNSGSNASVTLATISTATGAHRRCVFRRSTASGFTTSSGTHRIADCEWDSGSGNVGLSAAGGRIFGTRLALHDLTATNAVQTNTGDSVFSDVLVSNFNGSGNCFNIVGNGNVFVLTRCTGHCKGGNSATQVFNFNSGHIEMSWCVAAGAQGSPFAYGFFNNVANADCKLRNCFSYNNASGDSSGFTSDQIESLTHLSSDPFTNAAAGDFSPASGSPIRGVSFGFPGVSTTSYPDAGAAQSQTTGSTTYVINKTINRFTPEYEV